MASLLETERTSKAELLKFIDWFYPHLIENLKTAADRENTRINLTRDVKERADELNDTCQHLNSELKKTRNELLEEQQIRSNFESKVRETTRTLQDYERNNKNLKDELDVANRNCTDQMKRIMELEKEITSLERKAQEMKRHEVSLEKEYQQQLVGF